MGDATARRERRRQRILENSENRMKRITGDVQSWSDAKSQPTSPHSQSSFHHPIDTDTVMREHMPREPSQGGMENPDISSSYEPEALSNPRQRTVFTRKVDSMEPSHMSQITELQTSNQKTDVINDPVFALLLNFLGEKNIREKLVLILASLVNILIFLNFGSWFYELCLMPFSLLEVWLAHVDMRSLAPKTEGTHVLSAALVLSGLPAPKVSLFLKFTNIVSRIGTDLALYIFSIATFHKVNDYFLHVHNDAFS